MEQPVPKSEHAELLNHLVDMQNTVLYTLRKPVLEQAESLIVWLEQQGKEKDATIAALQARVQELEGIKIPDDAFTYCAYCGEKSPVDEHNEDLSAHIKVCPKHPMRDVESQLTQRTAELEAIERILDIDSGKTTVEKVRDLHHSFKQVWESYQDASNEMFKAQAELERVRLLSSHNERRFEMLEEKYKRLRTLIAALPKVEGEIRVIEVATDEWHVYDTIFATKAGADNYAALLQHRQGMEG